EHEHRECDACALAARERIRATLDLVAGKTKAPEMPLDHSSIPGRPQIVDRIVQGLVERHLRHVLAIVANRDSSADAKLSARDGMFAHERAYQRRLSGSVRPDEAESVAAHQRRIEIFDEHAVVDTHARSL